MPDFPFYLSGHSFWFSLLASCPLIRELLQGSVLYLLLSPNILFYWSIIPFWVSRYHLYSDDSQNYLKPRSYSPGDAAVHWLPSSEWAPGIDNTMSPSSFLVSLYPHWPLYYCSANNPTLTQVISLDFWASSLILFSSLDHKYLLMSLCTRDYARWAPRWSSIGQNGPYSWGTYSLRHFSLSPPILLTSTYCSSDGPLLSTRLLLSYGRVKVSLVSCLDCLNCFLTHFCNSNYFQTNSKPFPQYRERNLPKTNFITPSLLNTLGWLLTALRIKVKLLIKWLKAKAWPRPMGTLGMKTTQYPFKPEVFKYSFNGVNQEKLILLIKIEYPLTSKVRNLPYALNIM